MRLVEVLSQVAQVGPYSTFYLAYSPSFLSALTLPPTTFLNKNLPGHLHQHLLLPFLSFLTSFPRCKHLTEHNFLADQTQHLPDHHFPQQEHFRDTTDSSGPEPRPCSGSPLRPFSLFRLVEVLSVVFLCRSTFAKILQLRLVEVLSQVVQVGPEFNFFPGLLTFFALCPNLAARHFP